MIDPARIRAQFPIFTQAGARPPAMGQLQATGSLVFLDSAASTQQPEAVIEAVAEYHRSQHANIHRAVYRLSQSATRLYESARERVAGFLNAAEPAECLFTSGTTQGINLVASSWGRANLMAGDEIILTTLEHHSNIVPWQLVAQATGARIRVIPINDAGELDLDAFRILLSSRTRLVALNHVSNALGTINPVAQIIAEAHDAGARVLVDGAQWVAHGKTDVQALDADFYVFSAHKLYGPTGVGVLYGKRDLLEAMPPYQGGGDMIERVSFDGTRFAGLPSRFEAGTPNIAGVVGLGAAIQWLTALDLAQVGAYERGLLAAATQRFDALPGVEVKGTAAEKSAVISFIVKDPPIAALDVGTELDLRGICIRTGHHCCQPLMERLGVPATARASFALYNGLDDVERLGDALEAIIEEAGSSARRQRGTVTGQPTSTAASPRPLTPDPQSGHAILYPTATASSPEAAAARLAEDFELLPDWSSRHAYIIELGERLPPMPAALKTDANRVQGCQSTVYLDAQPEPGERQGISFLADSDAAIVRGLIALVQQIYAGQSATAIRDFDLDGYFARIGLDQHLSLSRRNGLSAMVQRLRGLAATLASQGDEGARV